METYILVIKIIFAAANWCLDEIRTSPLTCVIRSPGFRPASNAGPFLSTSYDIANYHLLKGFMIENVCNNFLRLSQIKLCSHF